MMHIPTYVFRLLLAIALLPAIAHAQIDSAGSDTTAAAPPTPEGAPGRQKIPDELPMTKSPVLAVSLGVLPGGGQFYTEQYIKGAIFAAAAGFMIYRVYDNHQQFTAWADSVRSIANPDDAAFTRARSLREFYRDERDYSFALFLGVQILGMIDAYVSAHLYDFDVDGADQAGLYLDLSRGIGLKARF